MFGFPTPVYTILFKKLFFLTSFDNAGQVLKNETLAMGA